MRMLLNNLDIFDYLLSKKRSGGGGQLVKVKVMDASSLFHYEGAVTNANPERDVAVIQKYIDVSDFSECENFSMAFYYSSDLIDLRNVNMNRATNIYCTFFGCTRLKYIPESINFENIINMEYAFYNCYALENIPKDMYIPNCTSMEGAFQGLSIEEIDFHRTTTKVNTLRSAFYRCKNLKKIRGLDVVSASKSDSFHVAFQDSPELEELEMFNIQSTLMIGYGTSFGHKLTLDSLIHTIRELISNNNTRTLTVGYTNLEKLSNIYVKLTEELDLTNRPKVPFEVCESTDEGAMLITEYVLLKNWQIQ